jgi:Tfp pilus assembly protein PilV
MQHHNKPSSGFALLLTLVVVSVVISIGLTLLELTVKQLRLSTGTKDSENAFHAANAGVECVRYWRLASSTQFENGIGNTVPMRCFGSAVTSPTITDLSPVGPELLFKYDVEFTWGAATAQRCSKLSFITLSSDPASAGVTLVNIPSYIPGYPYTNKTCIAGGRCTIVSVQGYNQPCTATTALGTVQREVLLEL